MKFLADAQLPPALTRWLVNQGNEAEHVRDCGLLEASNRTIWNYAVSVGAVIVTKDEDFALRRALEGEGPDVVWIRLGNSRTAKLPRWLEPMLPGIVSALERGERLIEVS